MLLGAAAYDVPKVRSATDTAFRHWWQNPPDVHYTAVVEREVLRKGRRALLIAGGGHLVRGIYADRAGWFDGNATNLFPIPERDRAAKIVGLIGGPDQVLARRREALAASDFQWAAELADYVLANDSANAGAKRIKAQALTELGERQINAIARNYYLSSAMYLLRDLPPQ